MERIIGIDLGTTYSCVAIFNERKGVFEVLPNKEGQQTTPSVVGLNKKGELIVGDAAKRLMATDAETVAEIKRHMGELTADGKAYTVRFSGKEHTPEEISAYLLRHLKESAERALGQKVTGAVITVPAYFEEPQRQATMRAGKMAGLDVKRIINEPTAAAIAYGHDQKEEEDEDEDAESRPIRLLIYDLGGGTFDVSIIEVDRGNIRVRATSGDHYLGGVDFDRSIAAWITQQIRTRHGVDVDKIAATAGKDGARGRAAQAQIRAVAEGYKKELSAQETVTVMFSMLPVVDPKTGEAIEGIELELGRLDFEQMIATRLGDSIKRVDAALTDAKMKPNDIDEVILVGGLTRIPMVKRLLTKHFGKEPRTDIHPDLCVALGAAHEAVKHINIDAAESAEARAAVEAKIAEMPAVVDVTGHSLGIAVLGGGMSVLIPRQTPIPALVTDSSFVTVADNQAVARVMVYQGEAKQVKENTLLGEFELTNLPRRRAGEVRIEVQFALDSNDTLTVTARDCISGQQAEVELKDERLRGSPPNLLLPSSGAARAPASSAAVGGGGGGGSGLGAAPPISEKYRKIASQALELLPKLADAARARLTAALEALYGAVNDGDGAGLEKAGNALVDTLFEVRP